MSELNPVQKEAVSWIHGPVVIYAGAGSGKTTVICHRIQHLIQSKVSPSSILGVTFTNKASQEMKKRVSEFPRGEHVTISTFHSISARFLRMFARAVGLTESFSIVDDGDQKTLLKAILKELNIQDSVLTPQILKSHIDKFKNQGFLPEDILQNPNILDTRKIFQKFGEVHDLELILKCYSLYQSRLLSLNSADFNDLLLLVVKLLSENQEILNNLQNRYEYFLVDEFQDTNPIQFEFIRLLSSRSQNLCIVGDDDQSIYSWRGACPEFMMNFQKYFEKAKIFKLEQNYRSTIPIVSAASAVVANNTIRSPKKLWTDKNSASLIHLNRYADIYDEASHISQQISEENRKGKAYNRIAILYRTNAQSRALEEHLRRKVIPYVIFGSVRFYERWEIKSLLSYFKVLVNVQDDVSFEKTLALPKKGFGQKSIEYLQEQSKILGLGVYQTALRIVEDSSSPLSFKARQLLLEKMEFFQRIKAQLMQDASLNKILNDTLTFLDFREYLKSYYPEDEEERWINVMELSNALLEFSAQHENLNSLEKLHLFLQECSLITDATFSGLQEFKDDAVTLMTIHAAKGLEFDTVFIVGLEEGTLPHYNSLDNELDVEEERRLMYVAMTRAKNQLYISHVMKNRLRMDTPTEPSRFISEIPLEYLTEESQLVATTKEKTYFSENMQFLKFPKSAPFRHGSVKPSNTLVSGTSIYSQKKDVSFFKAQDDCPWKSGQQVQHSIFGTGKIEKIEKSSDGYKLEIRFPQVGIKKLMDSYVQAK
jgi:DNA helicase-2/ATP-dependent DNA helicase PcrA